MYVQIYSILNHGYPIVNVLNPTIAKSPNVVIVKLIVRNYL